MSVGWSVAALAAAICCYTASTLLLAQAASTGDGGRGRGSLRHALQQPAWWAATSLQGLAFVVLLGARYQLPLLVVQPAVACTLATATVAGALLGRWRLLRRDVLAIALVVLGVALAASVARPGPAHPLGIVAVLVVLGAQAAALTALAAGARVPAIVTGMGAGLAFGSAAVAGRAWAVDVFAVLERPEVLMAAVLTVVGTVVGQLTLSVALSAGRVGGPVAGMFAVQTSAPAAIGVLLLGDRLVPGGAPVAVAGVLVAVVASLLLAEHGAGVSTTP